MQCRNAAGKRMGLRRMARRFAVVATLAVTSLSSAVWAQTTTIKVWLHDHPPRVAIDKAIAAEFEKANPDNAWVQWALRSLRQTTGDEPVLLPNLGGTLPNDVFADVLGMPTLWVPHSYPGCSQHAPNEHLLGSVAREALGVMAGLWWDLGEAGPAIVERRLSRA